MLIMYWNWYTNSPTDKQQFSGIMKIMKRLILRFRKVPDKLGTMQLIRQIKKGKCPQQHFWMHTVGEISSWSPWAHVELVYTQLNRQLTNASCKLVGSISIFEARKRHTSIARREQTQIYYYGNIGSRPVPFVSLPFQHNNILHHVEVDLRPVELEQQA